MMYTTNDREDVHEVDQPMWSEQEIVKLRAQDEAELVEWLRARTEYRRLWFLPDAIRLRILRKCRLR
jgi:hypothetical protein